MQKRDEREREGREGGKDAGERRERERGGKEELHLNGAMKSKVRMIKSLSPLNQATPQKRSLICYHWHCYSCCALITI